ncbi:MAG: iron-containing redox enzyme family protein [Nitrospira sp.]|nr:MAG: iron-containing redox enzyme family protein [Nitrospira sp.]
MALARGLIYEAAVDAGWDEPLSMHSQTDKQWEALMITACEIQEMYRPAAVDFWRYPATQHLVRGGLSEQEVRTFIANVFRTHFTSPHILAFLYSSMPSHTSGLLRNNLLEELGLTGDGPAHPLLLLDLAEGAGFTKAELFQLMGESHDHIRRVCSGPLPFPTLQAFYLSVLLETEAFEFLLSRYAGPLGAALHTRYGLTRQAVCWFDLHAEADIRHAEEGLQVLADFLAFYRIGPDEFEKTRRATFQANVFLQRDFPEALSATPTPKLAETPLCGS